MSMINKNIPICSIVGYEHLKLYQPSDCFRITSDTIALANFVNIRYRDKKILDIGTGLGGIPLILSNRGSAKIIGVEVNKSVAHYANASVSLNHLEDRITIIPEDIRNFSKNSAPNIYDIIVSNPPYYATERGFVNSHEIVATAKHDENLQLSEIFQIAKKLLKDQGRFCLVFTTDRLLEIVNFYQEYHFAIKRIQFVYGTSKKCAKIFLIEGTKNGKQGTKICPPLILEPWEGEENETKKL